VISIIKVKYQQYVRVTEVPKITFNFGVYVCPDVASTFPPEVLVLTAAVDKNFFHIIPQHGTINHSP
jgi:hypothetical protein